MSCLTALPLILLVASGEPGGKDVLRFSALPGEAELGRWLWDRAPGLAVSRARVSVARAQITRSEALPNPTLDLSWNTIPVGETNPAHLNAPLSNVPNYAVFLSQPFELGKRGPRQRAARHGAEAALWDAVEQLRLTWLDLQMVIARAASSEQRIAALTGLAEDAGKLSELQRRRAEKGDVANLEFERARLEEERLRSSLAEERHKLEVALTDCARLTGAICEPFGQAERAHAFFDAAVSRSREGVDSLRARVTERPDVKSLAASEQAAQATGDLARARVWPDPSLRVGFVYDTFTVSGNQNKSVSVGVSLPLPVFERGRADRAEASATGWAVRQTRDRALAQAEVELPLLLRQLDELRARRTRMRESILPSAQSIVERISKAVAAGGALLQDLFQARRTLGDLLGDAADLDLAAFETSLALLRAAGNSPVAIETLRQNVTP
jgi:cobalt-zinc-cadmium efflux system outer membrane protein